LLSQIEQSPLGPQRDLLIKRLRKLYMAGDPQSSVTEKLFEGRRRAVTQV
jgi:hypothetical protein